MESTAAVETMGWDDYWLADMWREDRKWALYRAICEQVIGIVAEKGRGITLADVGCGPGMLIDRLRNLAGVRVVGIDSSEIIADMCKARGRLVLNMDAHDLHVDGDGLDVLVSTCLLDCQGVDPVAALAGWRAAMREHGRLIVAVASADQEPDYPRGTTFTAEQLSAAIVDAGFRHPTCETVTSGGVAYLLARATT